MEKLKNSKNGVTLLALVVTIIVLLILAGIAMTLVIGDNGIFSRTKKAKETYEESKAREKLELILSDLQIEKNVNSEYKQENIDTELEKHEIIVVDNIAIVDGWKFEIDKSVPKIVNSLGKGEESNKISIMYKEEYTKDYVKATLKIDIKDDDENISEILINGKNIEVPVVENGVYKIEYEVTENGNYIILVKNQKGEYKIDKIIVSELTEDMDIYDRTTMEQFRDKVNAGRTFEGKVARVIKDIDLQGFEDNQWTPIANCSENNELTFKGEFEGNNHTISGIYINKSSGIYQGLFGINEGTIKNVKVIGEIKGNKLDLSAGISGYNGGVIENCHNYIMLQGNEYIGGVAGQLIGEIYECSNNKQIIANNNVGGIVRLYE